MPDLALKVFRENDLRPNEVLPEGVFIAMSNKWRVDWDKMRKSIDAAYAAGLMRNSANGGVQLTQAGYDKIHA